MNKEIRNLKTEKMYLYIALAVIILLITYRFIYFNNIAKAKTIGNELKNLRLKESELQIKNDKVKTIKENNKNLQNKINNIIDSYSYGVSVDSIVFFLKSLEEESNMSINMITLSEPEYVAVSGQHTLDNQSLEDQTAKAPVNDGDISAKVPENTALAASINNTAQTAAQGIDEKNGINCYKTTVKIEFQVSYEGIKKGLDYINNSSGKKNIEEINLTYDMETGNLRGTMAINMYYLTGTGKKYKEPAIGGVKIGTSNIFGTIKLPEDKEEKASATE